MFGRRSHSSSSNKSKKSLSQYGFMDVPDLSNIENLNDLNNIGDNIDDDDDDDALEAELLALTSNDKPAVVKKTQMIVNPNELDKMIQDSLRDIPSDEDVSSGEDDPAILDELKGLQVDSSESINYHVEQAHSENTSHDSLKILLYDRLKMYEIAEKNAKSVDDLSKARRMTRGITALQNLINQVNNGRKINEDEIPPVISVAVTSSSNKPSTTNDTQVPVENTSLSINVPVEPPPIPPRILKHSSPSFEDRKEEPKLKMKLTDENIQDNTSVFQNNVVSSTFKESLSDNVMKILTERQEQYKKAAVEIKKTGDIQTALNYVKIVKQFDTVINEAKNGAMIDISSLPPPIESPHFDFSGVSKTISPLKRQDSEKQTSASTSIIQPPEIEQVQPIPHMSDSYVEPKTVMEALEQRLAKFKDSENTAKKENNSSKMRRMGRIVKQYEDAIKLHKAGKPFPVDELPTPPGFAPIPVKGDLQSSLQPIPNPKPPTSAVSPKPSSNLSDKNSVAQTKVASRNEKQSLLLLEKQKTFKLAALKAKQSGDVETAKEYLKLAKGFDSLIEASRAGLPVDLSSLPVPPDDKKSLNSGYNVIKLNDCIEGSDLDVFHKLQIDLEHQVKMCIQTRDHFKTLGDVANANRVEQLALQSKKDLKFVQLAEANNLKIPKFHYETKPFSIVQCNTDLTDNDVEITIIQGINYNVPNPKEIDTYVKLYFPYPTEAPQQHKSATVYNTNNPAYNVTVIFSMQRNVRACQRIFKRQTLKCEVWSKGGFLRSDSLVGTANVKLQPLETQCTLHDAYDLMDGRRTVGGKVEVKIRIRDPIVKKQVEHVEEKWLIIDT